LFIGIAALAFMLWEPQIEGINAQATQFEVYFKDLFLAYAYVASIPFFLALFQAFKLLGFAGQNQVFAPAAVKALRTMKYCGLTMLGFVIVSVVFMPFADPDDRPPGVMIRLVLAFGSIVIATAAAIFERLLQHAVDMKSESDLTV
jgi:hypothetical protein